MTSPPRAHSRLLASLAALSLTATACITPLARTDDGEPLTSAGECTGVHPGARELATEHCAALLLADPAAATHVAVQDGDWSDSSTWRGGSPADGDAVHIPADTTVTVDTTIDATLDTLRVDGTLRFAPTVDTALEVDTLVGSPESTFAMGTADEPIARDVSATLTVADDGPVDLAADPTQLGRGVILHGKVSVAGAAKTPWGVLASAPQAGATTLALSFEPEGWGPGDRLVLPGMQPDATGEEEAVVASVEGRSVRLEAPLALDHVPPRDDLAAHVANLTRNATFRSASTALDRRGHVMFMHSRDVHVAHAGFSDLGRTDKSRPLADVLADEDTGEACRTTAAVTNPRARYSVHFHRNGVTEDGAPATISGSVVEGDPGWGFVNHSSNVDFTGNVAYDVTGAGFSTEVGDETGSFVDNLSVRTHGDGSLPPRLEQPTERRATQDFGFAGHGFWLQGPSVRLEGNVAAGATGAGIMVYAEALIEPGVGRAAIGDEDGGDPFPVVQQPLAGITDNDTYGSSTGLWIYYHRTGITLGQEEATALAGAPPDLPLSVVDGLRSYANLTGVRTNYTVDTEFRDFTIVAPDDVAGLQAETGPEGEPLDLVGFDATNVYNHGVHRYTGFDVEGYPVGLLPSSGGDVAVEGGRFANLEADIVITPPRQVDRRITVSGPISFPGADADGRARIQAAGDLRTIVDSDEAWYQLHDRIIVEPGALPGPGSGETRQVFYPEQAADHVLFAGQPEVAEPEDPGEPVPDEHIGLTNAELAEQGGPLGGTLPGPDAAPAPGVGGLIGAPTAAPELVLDAGRVLESLLAEDLADEEEDGEPEEDLTVDELLEEEGLTAEELMAEEGITPEQLLDELRAEEADEDEQDGGEDEASPARADENGVCGPEAIEELRAIAAGDEGDQDEGDEVEDVEEGPDDEEPDGEEDDADDPDDHDIEEVGAEAAEEAATVP